MATAKISLIGLYKYGQSNNIDIFSGITVPAGLDKTKLTNAILMDGAEFEVLYPDLSYFQFLAGVWSGKHQFTMERWARLIGIDYNPLENYDRMEDWTDAGTRTDKSNRNDSAMSWNAGYKDYGSTDTHDVAAYDSSTYSPRDQDTNTGGGVNEDGNQTMTSGITDSKTADNSVHTGRMHGNIGTVTSQQMFNEEKDVARFNVYEELAALFLQEFCVYTY